jgi:hypothetical protein
MGLLCTEALSSSDEKMVTQPPCNGQEPEQHLAYVKQWHDVFQARHNKPVLLKLLREATQGFVAVTDAPANCFIPELLELYPDAVVVDVLRDRAKWWKSFKMVLDMADAKLLSLILAPVPGKRWFPSLVKMFLQT